MHACMRVCRHVFIKIESNVYPHTNINHIQRPNSVYLNRSGIFGPTTKSVGRMSLEKLHKDS